MTGGTKRESTCITSGNRFDLHENDASGSGAEMSRNSASYRENRANWIDSSQFGATVHKMRLTPWGRQLNVANNSEKFTPRETNAPPGVVQAPHLAFSNGFP
jgi:hypothetical protein